MASQSFQSTNQTRRPQGLRADPSLTEANWATADEAIAALKLSEAQAHYSVSRSGSTRLSVRGKATGDIYRHDYRCTCWKKKRHPDHTYTPLARDDSRARQPGAIYRKTTTQTTACPFFAIVYINNVTDLWHIRFKCDTHNHTGALNALADPALRRLDREKVTPGRLEREVEKLANTARMTSEQIAAFIRGNLDESDMVAFNDFLSISPAADPNEVCGIPDLDLDEADDAFHWGDTEPLPTKPAEVDGPLPKIAITADDVKNIQKKLRNEKYGPLSATQLFIHQLEQHKQRHGVMYKVDRNPATGRITRVFFTFKWCLKMWKQNPDLMMADNTYKVGSCYFFWICLYT